MYTHIQRTHKYNTDVAVHQHCYGHPLTNGIPDGDWLCEMCESKCKEEKCVCCPVRRGAMKRTIDFRWIHVSCAMYVPEAFCHAEGLDAINYFHIPKSRFELACSYCNFSKEGACVKCAYKGCKTSFHISCGMRQKVPILCEMKHIGKGKPDLVLTYCSEHAPIASKMGKKVRYQVA